jgi:hypothetical protein
VKKKRSIIKPNRTFLFQLAKLEKELYGSTTLKVDEHLPLWPSYWALKSRM